MWICLNNAFLSIVEPGADDPVSFGQDMLLVRARIKGHIETVFPGAEVKEVPGRDYQFRSYILRPAVASAIASSIAGISYGNFKNSVQNRPLHSAYACVWGVMAQLQEIPPYEKKPRRRKLRSVDPDNPYLNDPVK